MASFGYDGGQPAAAMAFAELHTPHLLDLPSGPLHQILRLVHEQPGGAAIRAACRSLHEHFDACVTSLSLGSADSADATCPELPGLRARLLSLCSRCPSINTIALRQSALWLGVQQVLDSGGTALCGRLCTMTLQGRLDADLLAPLALCPALRSLDISQCTALREATLLPELTALTRLNASRCERLRDIAPLASCKSLQELNLSRCYRLRDLSPLSSLVSLADLVLGDCHKVSCLEVLSKLTALSSLDLQHCYQVSNIRPLSTLARLCDLNLNHCSRVRELHAPLAPCTALRRLDLSNCWRFEDVNLGPRLEAIAVREKPGQPPRLALSDSDSDDLPDLLEDDDLPWGGLLQVQLIGGVFQLAWPGGAGWAAGLGMQPFAGVGGAHNNGPDEDNLEPPELMQDDSDTESEGMPPGLVAQDGGDEEMPELVAEGGEHEEVPVLVTDDEEEEQAQSWVASHQAAGMPPLLAQAAAELPPPLVADMSDVEGMEWVDW